MMFAAVPDGSGGRGEIRIGKASHRDRNMVRCHIEFPVDRGSAIGTEVHGECAPCIRASFEYAGCARGAPNLILLKECGNPEHAARALPAFQAAAELTSSGSPLSVIVSAPQAQAAVRVLIEAC